jgi:hypothetical protein
MGCPRIYTTVKVNTRIDRDQTLEDKVAGVEALLQARPERGQRRAPRDGRLNAAFRGGFADAETKGWRALDVAMPSLGCQLGHHSR